MADHFKKLGVRRSPWLEADELKARFLALSAEHHPDKAGGEKASAEAEFREINEAYNVLRNTRNRLLHLMELEGMAKSPHVQSVPPLVMELFAPVAEVTRRAGALLKEKPSASSPMLKVQFFERALDCVEAIQNLQGVVQERIRAIEEQLRASPDADAGTLSAERLDQLGQAAAALGFLERWNAQLSERSAALTF